MPRIHAELAAAPVPSGRRHSPTAAEPDQHGRLERVRPPPASVNERVRAAFGW
jgi:hypothetical protein